MDHDPPGKPAKYREGGQAADGCHQPCADQWRGVKPNLAEAPGKGYRLLGKWLALGFLQAGVADYGWVHTLLLTVAAAFALLRFRVHPALVVLGGLLYGALLLG